jgi:hypothetical protein
MLVGSAVSIERRPDWPPFLSLDIVWRFHEVQPLQDEGSRSLLACKIGCGTKIVADEMINKPSPDYERIVSKDSEFAWRSR